LRVGEYRDIEIFWISRLPFLYEPDRYVCRVAEDIVGYKTAYIININYLF